MCRMLLVGNSADDSLRDRVAIFLNVLGLKVDLMFAENCDASAALLSSGSDIDIVMSTLPCWKDSSLFSHGYSVFAPDSKWLFCTDEELPESMHNPQTFTISTTFEIDEFYDVFSRLSPSTVLAAPQLIKSTRWYSNHKVLLGRVMIVLKYIRENYMNDLSLNELSDSVLSSPCYLSTLFSKFVGISPMQYCNNYRMNQALILLRCGEYTVTEVGSAVGFRSLPYFCTCFKNRFGITPAQFRRRFHPEAYSKRTRSRKALQ